MLDGRVNPPPVRARVPLYLVVDLADDGWSQPKDRVLHGLVPALAGRVDVDPDLRDTVRLAVIGFADRAYTHQRMGQLQDSGSPLRRAVSKWRSYKAALLEVREAIFDDTYSADYGHLPPLVLFVTDGASDIADHWEPALEDLVRNQPDVVVTAIHYPGPSATGGNGLPVHGPLGPSRADDAHPDHLAFLAVEVIRAHVRRVEEENLARLAAETAARRAADRASPRPRREPAKAVGRHSLPQPEAPEPPAEPAGPEWTGVFEPFVVGDPGNAAHTVRPVPDVTEWDRRDTVLDGVRLGGGEDGVAVELRAASVRGLAHRYYGTVRQDDYAFRCTPDQRYLVAAVSDGVSNSKLSHKAAAMVTRLGCELVASMLRSQPPDVLDWPGLMVQLSDQVAAMGEKLIDRPEDAAPLTYREVAQHLAATALFAVVDLLPEQGRIWAHVFAVGDSPAFVLRDGQTWEPQGAVKNEGNLVASSSTAAVPIKRDKFDPPVAVHLGPGDVLVLMTDGIGDPLGDGSNSVGRFLAQAWARPPLPLAFAAQVDFARRSQDDDRTALAIWPETER